MLIVSDHALQNREGERTACATQRKKVKQCHHNERWDWKHAQEWEIKKVGKRNPSNIHCTQRREPLSKKFIQHSNLKRRSQTFGGRKMAKLGEKRQVATKAFKPQSPSTALLWFRTFSLTHFSCRNNETTLFIILFDGPWSATSRNCHWNTTYALLIHVPNVQTDREPDTWKLSIPLDKYARRTYMYAHSWCTRE